MIEAYPLCWPPQYPRTDSSKESRFKTTLGAARDYVKEEIRRLGGESSIISTNIPLKNNGDLRADYGFKIPDPGVAVYFTLNNNQVCLCCDTYERVWDNLHAIGRTINALRQIDRDGVSDFLNRAFTGFKALPEVTAAEVDIWNLLGLKEKPGNRSELEEAYKKQARLKHPDKGGSADAFADLNEAYRKAKQLFK